MILDVLKTVSTTQPGEKSISYKEIMNFYVPLILTSFISLGVQPIVTFFMGQSGKQKVFKSKTVQNVI